MLTSRLLLLLLLHKVELRGNQVVFITLSVCLTLLVLVQIIMEPCEVEYKISLH